MAFNLGQIKDLITRVITAQELYSENAVNLLLGTMAVESDFGTYLYQKNGGPAKGIFQMEVPITEEDIWENHLKSRYYRRVAITKMCGVFSPMNEGAMEWNLKYQICMARLHYKRVKEPFPNPYDIIGLAKYWKKYWNTPKGKGIEAEFIQKYIRYCGMIPKG